MMENALRDKLMADLRDYFQTTKLKPCDIAFKTCVMKLENF
jgi:hypothetical protein